jgi:hypothetical protein
MTINLGEYSPLENLPYWQGAGTVLGALGLSGIGHLYNRYMPKDEGETPYHRQSTVGKVLRVLPWTLAGGINGYAIGNDEGRLSALKKAKKVWESEGSPGDFYHWVDAHQYAYDKFKNTPKNGPTPLNNITDEKAYSDFVKSFDPARHAASKGKQRIWESIVQNPQIQKDPVRQTQIAQFMQQVGTKGADPASLKKIVDALGAGTTNEGTFLNMLYHQYYGSPESGLAKLSFLKCAYLEGQLAAKELYSLAFTP